MTSSSLRIVPLEPSDVDARTEVMTRAFDDDAQRRESVRARSRARRPGRPR